MIKPYLQVTKPGIIVGNLISVVGGFLLASKGSINGYLLILTLLGVSLVVASGCAFNNLIDRDIDPKMERTKNRVLVRGLASAHDTGYCRICCALFWRKSLSHVVICNGLCGLCRDLQSLYETAFSLRNFNWQSVGCRTTSNRLLRCKQ